MKETLVIVLFCLTFFFSSSSFFFVLFAASSVHPGIFAGQTLLPDHVSPRMNTTTSRDQFKPSDSEKI